MPTNPFRHYEELKKLTPARQELYLKSHDLTLKEQEIKVKRFSGLTIPLYIAAIGFIAQLIVTTINTFQQQRLEKERVRSTAILDAIKTGDTTQAKGNLKFLIGIHFLEDSDSAIINYLDTTRLIPVLPGKSANSVILNDSAFLCKNSTTFAFHKNLDCRGLNKCTQKIIKTSVAGAYMEGKKPCGFCY